MKKIIYLILFTLVSFSAKAQFEGHLGELGTIGGGDYALVRDSLFKGSYRPVADSTIRNAITLKRRSKGMWVKTLSDSTVWELRVLDTLNGRNWKKVSFGDVTAGSQTVLTNKKLTSTTDTLGSVTAAFGSDAKGDIYYRDAGGHLTNLPIGSSLQQLTSFGGLPVWASPATIPPDIRPLNNTFTGSVNSFLNSVVIKDQVDTTEHWTAYSDSSTYHFQSPNGDDLFTATNGIIKTASLIHSTDGVGSVAIDPDGIIVANEFVLSEDPAGIYGISFQNDGVLTRDFTAVFPSSSNSTETIAYQGYVTSGNHIGISGLSATGSPSSSTFYRGDNTWATLPTLTFGRGLSNVSSTVKLDTAQNYTFLKTLSVLSTSLDQLHLEYDATHYMAFNINSSGSASMTTTGANPDITWTPGGAGRNIFNANVGSALPGNIFNNNASGTVTNIASFFAPNATTTTYAGGPFFNFGVAPSTNNSGTMQFNYIGSGSSSNTISFGIYGTQNPFFISSSKVSVGGANFGDLFNVGTTGQFHVSTSGVPTMPSAVINGNTNLNGFNANIVTLSAISGYGIQNSLTNARTSFAVIPSGTSSIADFWASNSSDVVTNYGFLIVGYNPSATAGWGISTRFGGTQTAKPIYIDASGSSSSSTANVIFNVDQSTTFQGVVKLKGYTVSTLPTGSIGMTAYVTDATVTTYGSVPIGSGINIVPVFYNGTNWIIY